MVLPLPLHIFTEHILLNEVPSLCCTTPARLHQHTQLPCLAPGVQPTGGGDHSSLPRGLHAPRSYLLWISGITGNKAALCGPALLFSKHKMCQWTLITPCAPTGFPHRDLNFCFLWTVWGFCVQLRKYWKLRKFHCFGPVDQGGDGDDDKKHWHMSNPSGTRSDWLFNSWPRAVLR